MVDTERMKKDRADKAKGGDFVKLANGDTVLYCHPLCRGDEDKYPPTQGLNYIDATYHYDVGPQGMMHLCLNAKENPIIKHPFILEFAKKKGIKLDFDKECPTCKLRESGGMDEKKAERCRPQSRFTWGVTPLRHRATPTSPWQEIPPNPGVYQCGKTVWEGIVDLFGEHGDITDPTAAVLVKINKTGKDLNTKYTVTSDGATARAPMKLDKSFARQISDACRKDGDCDLFRVVAGCLRSHGEVTAALSGVKVEDDSGGEPSTEGD